MSNNNRELTGKEKRQIKKLITSLCASYDKEYGCLPLDCDCPMFGICYTNSGLCSYFRESVLPAEPELQAVFESQPFAKNVESTFRRTANEFTVRKNVPKKPAADKPQQGYASTEKSIRKHIKCNHFAPEKPCAARFFPERFYVGNGFIPFALF